MFHKISLYIFSLIMCENVRFFSSWLFITFLCFTERDVEAPRGNLATPAGDSPERTTRWRLTSDHVTPMSVSQAAVEIVCRRWRTRCRQGWERRKRRRRRTASGIESISNPTTTRRETRSPTLWGLTTEMLAATERNATCQVGASPDNIHTYTTTQGLHIWQLQLQ